MAKVEDSWIVQRWNGSVLRRRQPTEPGLHSRTGVPACPGYQLQFGLPAFQLACVPGLPRMDDEMLAPTLGNGSHEVAGKLGRVKLICTQTWDCVGHVAHAPMLHQ